MKTSKLTEAQRKALALWPVGRDFVWENDVCTARIGKQLDALGLVERTRPHRGAIRLRLTDAGRAVLRGES